MTTLEKEPVKTECATNYSTPRVNLRQDADGYSLEVEMPGVGREGVEVTAEDGRLTLVGHRREAGTHGRPLYQERPARGYRRVFDLDPSIDASKITAHLEQGLLLVRLPKAEEVKPRKITVS